MTMTAITSRTSSRVKPRRGLMARSSGRPTDAAVRGPSGWSQTGRGRSLPARPVADGLPVRGGGPDVGLEALVAAAAGVVLVLLAPGVHQPFRLDVRLAAGGRLHELLERVGELAVLDVVG